MKLQEGQLWKLKDHYIRILYRDNLSVGFKVILPTDERGEDSQQLMKKPFCKMLKDAVLCAPGTIPFGSAEMVKTEIDGDD